MSGRAASLIRRVHRFSLGDRLSSSLAAESHHQISSSSRERKVPWLFLPSHIKPDSCYLFDLTKDEHYGAVGLNLHRELYLPQMAGSWCIGSSRGFIFSVSLGAAPAIHAINPLTGAHLRLPGFPNLYSCIPFAKATLSPSLDTVVLLPRGVSVSLEPAIFARLSPSASPSWTTFPSLPEMIGSVDCIFHKGRLFFISTFHDITIFDQGFFDSPSPPPPFVFRGKRYHMGSRQNIIREHLVESPDGLDLYVLLRIEAAFRTSSFRVFRLEETGEWEEVKSIGDVAFFVGRDGALSLSTRDFPFLVSNSIYFTDNESKGGSERDKMVGSIDTGIFYLEDASIEFLDIPIHNAPINVYPPPIWFEPASSEFHSSLSSEVGHPPKTPS